MKKENNMPEKSALRELTPFDIIWIKNITNSEDGTAYMDVDLEFVLHFPNKHYGNILKPQKEKLFFYIKILKDVKLLHI